MRKRKIIGIIICLICLISNYITINAQVISLDKVVDSTKIVNKDNENLEYDENSLTKQEIEEYEKVLLASGTPKTVLKTLSETQIAFIAENLEEGAKYELLETGNVYMGSNQGEISTCAVSALPSNLMTFTVVGYVLTTSPEKRVMIFPSFNMEWKLPYNK